MMYPETNFNYDNNNENKGNRKQRRQNKSRRNLHKAAAVFAGVLQAESYGADHF